ncbi:hypothetical protein BJF90_20680 [Pseudonocardia sp. CNS-004]|nr:hypothetical protein BJF90_20680 [Pseudonocardia sp. CNS-004]
MLGESLEGARPAGTDTLPGVLPGEAGWWKVMAVRPSPMSARSMVITDSASPPGSRQVNTSRSGARTSR